MMAREARKKMTASQGKGEAVVFIRAPRGRGRAAGEVFLEEATAIGADLMIKGAYTQSRLRQMIFGGATRHIIMEAEIPVVLAH